MCLLWPSVSFCNLAFCVVTFDACFTCCRSVKTVPSFRVSVLSWYFSSNVCGPCPQSYLIVESRAIYQCGVSDLSASKSVNGLCVFQLWTKLLDLVSPSKSVNRSLCLPALNQAVRSYISVEVCQWVSVSALTPVNDLCICVNSCWRSLCLSALNQAVRSHVSVKVCQWVSVSSSFELSC